ncbi:unnamed protein product [Heterobilharzia americana]|nr:unnamed protein product [Heterobilharzia americana]
MILYCYSLWGCYCTMHQHELSSLSLPSGNTHQQYITSTYSDIFKLLNCTVDYIIQLGVKPDIQHKEDTLLEHSKQSPVLSVGAYQWIELTCTCCCAYPDQWKQITNTQLIQTMNQTAVNQSLDNSNYTTTTLLYKITSSNGHVIALSLSKKIHSNIHLYHCENITTTAAAIDTDTYNSNSNNDSICITLYSEIKCNAPNGFYMHAENLGHSQITATLIWMNSTSRKHIDSLTKMTESFGIIDDHHGATGTVTTTTTTVTMTSPAHMKQHQKQLQEQTQYQLANKGINDILDPTQIKITDAKFINTLNNNLNGTWKSYLWLTVLLRPQKFYIASDWSSAVIAFMLALSVGCCDDPILVREQLYEPKPILTGLFCQLIIIPMLGLGLGVVFDLDIDQAFGLFICSTVPAGGLAYLLTYLSNGDRQLSAALSLISSIADLAVTPVWAMTIGWYWFNRPINIAKTFGWLLLIAGAQSIGTLMRGCRPGLARGILTWVTRPLLLLSGILLVTLGVYINHYAFNEVTQSLILALLTLITCGFAVGWLVGTLTNQGCTGSRTLSTASSVFNGLLCIPLLRTCVHAPEGDLAAVVALWTIFFAPIPLAYHAAVTIAEKWLTSYLQNRRRKREEENYMAAMIGGKQHQFGATSIAAVAAAAIAVTPAITAGSRPDKNKTSTAHSSEVVFYNDDDSRDNSAYVTQSPPIKTTFEASKKKSLNTVNTPTSSMNHPLQYESNLDNYGQHGVRNLYREHFKPIVDDDDDELELNILTNKNATSLSSNYKNRSPVFAAQQTRAKRANWLTDSINLSDKQQKREGRDESTETESMITCKPNDHRNMGIRMFMSHNSNANSMEYQPDNRYISPADIGKELKRASLQSTVNFMERDHHHSTAANASPPYTNL